MGWSQFRLKQTSGHVKVSGAEPIRNSVTAWILIIVYEGAQTGYWLDGPVVDSGRNKSSSSPAKRPDRLWAPPTLLFNEYRRFFPRVWSSRGVRLTTKLHLVQRSRMSGAVPLLPHASVAWTGKIYPFIMFIKTLSALYVGRQSHHEIKRTTIRRLKSFGTFRCVESSWTAWP